MARRAPCAAQSSSGPRARGCVTEAQRGSLPLRGGYDEQYHGVFGREGQPKRTHDHATAEPQSYTGAAEAAMSASVAATVEQVRRAPTPRSDTELHAAAARPRRRGATILAGAASARELPYSERSVGLHGWPACGGSCGRCGRAQWLSRHDTRCTPRTDAPLLTPVRVCALILSSQNQRAFQKQDNIFVGKKRALGSKKP